VPWFEGSHEETFTVPTSLEVTKQHFADPDTIVAHTADVASHHIDGGLVHFVLAKQDHGVVQFQGDYKCRYVLDGDVLRWTAEGGNTDQSGEATFTAADDGTEVAYREVVKVDLDVGKMMAPMLKPVMGPMIAHEIKEYLKRMRASLPS